MYLLPLRLAAMSAINRQDAYVNSRMRQYRAGATDRLVAAWGQVWDEAAEPVITAPETAASMRGRRERQERRQQRRPQQREEKLERQE